MELTPEEIKLIQGRRAEAGTFDPIPDTDGEPTEFVNAPEEPANEPPVAGWDDPPFPQGGEKLDPASYGDDE